LFVGNILEDKAKTISKHLVNTMSNRSLHRFNHIQKYVTIPKNAHYVYRAVNSNPNDYNSVFVNYFQLGEFNIRKNVLSRIAVHYFNSVAYDHLRNKLNIGYIANAFSFQIHKMMGIT